MLEILYSNTNYDFLDQPSCDEIEILRKDFSVFEILDLHTYRPYFNRKKLATIHFCRTRINRTIQLLLNIAGIKNSLMRENPSVLYIEITKEELISKWSSIALPLTDIDSHISILLE
jgi:ATP-dependent Lhr-like helicase